MNATARLLASAALLCIGACDLPRDPGGTLERVRDGELRVGITEHRPWTHAGAPEPGGIEAELVRGFASELGAKVRWVWGSEQRLFESLERHELDLVIGGLTDKSPWRTKVGFTKPYVDNERVVLEEGWPQMQTERQVMAVAPGENGFLRSLERFLRRERAEVIARLGSAG